MRSNRITLHISTLGVFWLVVVPGSQVKPRWDRKRFVGIVFFFSFRLAARLGGKTNPALETFSSDVVDLCLAGWGYAGSCVMFIDWSFWHKTLRRKLLNGRRRRETWERQAWFPLFWGSCCLAFPRDTRLFYPVFSALSPPLLGRLLSAFSLTPRPHYTASEHNWGRQLLETLHLLKMSLIASTGFGCSPSEEGGQRHRWWGGRRTGELDLGCNMFLLKGEPGLHDHAHLGCATLSRNAARY